MDCVVKKIKDFNALMDLLIRFDENVKFLCTPDGIKTQCLANGNTCIIQMSIEKGYFAEYHCEKDHAIGVNVKLIHSILKKSTKEDILTLKSTDTVLSIGLENDINKTTYELKLMDFEQDMMDIPSLEYNLSCHITPMVLKTWKNMCELTGESISFVPKENLVEMTSESSNHKMKRIESMSFDVFEQPKPFRLSNKAMIMVCSMNQFQKDLIMSYQNDTPIEFSFDMENIKIETWFAPMMDMDED